MSHWLTKNDEHCSQDSRDSCPTMDGDFINQQDRRLACQRGIFRQIGGSAWESNPPGTVLAPHTGFEVEQ